LASDGLLNEGSRSNAMDHSFAGRHRNGALHMWDVADSAAKDPETARDIIATQIRSQGYRCNHPKTAAWDADASKPDEFAWRLQCGQGSYLVRLIPHMAAKVERVGQ
jgi:hypothetical protein